MKQHSPRFLTFVADCKKQIQEITPHRLKDMLDHNEPMLLIDVREDHEWSLGHISTATHLIKGIIERDIEKKCPDLQRKMVVYCSGGFRSALVANSLQQMGYTQVYSLSSGLQGWVDAGFSLDK